MASRNDDSAFRDDSNMTLEGDFADEYIAFCQQAKRKARSRSTGAVSHPHITLIDTHPTTQDPTQTMHYTHYNLHGGKGVSDQERGGYFIPKTHHMPPIQTTTQTDFQIGREANTHPNNNNSPKEHLSPSSSHRSVAHIDRSPHYPVEKHQHVPDVAHQQQHQQIHHQRRSPLQGDYPPHQKHDAMMPEESSCTSGYPDERPSRRTTRDHGIRETFGVEPCGCSRRSQISEVNRPTQEKGPIPYGGEFGRVVKQNPCASTCGHCYANIVAAARHAKQKARRVRSLSRGRMDSVEIIRWCSSNPSKGGNHNFPHNAHSADVPAGQGTYCRPESGNLHGLQAPSWEGLPGHGCHSSAGRHVHQTCHQNHHLPGKHPMSALPGHHTAAFPACAYTAQVHADVPTLQNNGPTSAHPYQSGPASYPQPVMSACCEGMHCHSNRAPGHAHLANSAMMTGHHAF